MKLILIRHGKTEANAKSLESFSKSSSSTAAAGCFTTIFFIFGGDFFSFLGVSATDFFAVLFFAVAMT